MEEKREEIEVKTTLACVGCGKHCTKFPGPMDAIQKQKQVERSLSRSSWMVLITKREISHMEQKLWRQCQKIGRHTQAGRDGGQRREARRWREAQHQQALQTTAQWKRKMKLVLYCKKCWKSGGGPGQSLCNGTEVIRQVRRVHADVDRGPRETTLHGQNMADVTEQRRQVPQFHQKTSKNFWTWPNRQGG